MGTLTSCKNQSNRSQWKSKWCKTCVTATRTVFSFQNVASKQTTRSHNYEIVICCSQAKNQSKHQSMVAINKPCLNIQSTKGHKAFLSIVLTVPTWWWSVSLPYNLTVCVRILLKSTILTIKFMYEKKENKQKEAVVGPFIKIYVTGPTTY